MSRPETVTSVRVVEASALSLVVRFLRGHGFPLAARRALAAGRELGAVSGTPGVEWGVKSSRAVGGEVSGVQVGSWVVATEAHRVRVGAELAVLVVGAPDRSLDEVGEWAAYVTSGPGRCARMPLRDAVSLLLAMGYGGGPGPDDEPAGVA